MYLVGVESKEEIVGEKGKIVLDFRRERGFELREGRDGYSINLEWR